MKPIVVDCSVSMAWILPDESSEPSRELMKLVLSEELWMIQPSLWVYESINALKSAVALERTSKESAAQAIELLMGLPFKLIDPLPNSSKILETSFKYDITAYDATYLVSAEIHGAELYTADKDIIKLKTKLDYVKDIRKLNQKD